MKQLTWTNERRKLRDLTPWEHNPRYIKDKQAERLLESFNEFGQVLPICIGPRNEVYDGHQRRNVIGAADEYGLDYEVDVRVASRELSERERQKLTVYLHQGAQGSWDWEELANSFDFDDLVLWGFDEDMLLNMGSGNDEPAAPSDAEPQIDKAAELLAKWQVQPGDMWRIGEHRLVCGDCTDAATVARVMGGEKAAICLTDPPYGLGDAKESGKNSYDLYADSQSNLISLIAGWLPLASTMCSVVVFSPGVTNAWLYPAADWIMCWFYGGGQLRSSWGFNCWQPFLCYGKDPSLATGNGGRPDAINMNTPANASDIDHPCPKPTKLWEWFIERLSFCANDLFYEPFAGSGTTLVACQNLSRRCRAIELSPAYCAVILQRMSDAFPGIEIERIS